MADRLRVAMGTDYPYDESRVRGGVEAVSLYLVHALGKRSDLDLHVVSCRREVGEAFSEQRGRVTFHWLPRGRRLHLLRVVTTEARRTGIVYRTIRPDVIHAQDYEAAVGAPGGCPTVLTPHGFEMFVQATLRSARYRGPVGMYRRVVEQWIARRSLRRADAVISIAGNYVPEQIGKRNRDGRPVYYIANPIADEFWPVREGNGASGLTVLYVGEIIERKNVHSLVQAFAQVARPFPQSSLRLAGGIAEPAYGARVREEIASLGLENRIVFLGRLTQPELLEEYAGCSLVALASIQETAPVALAQAMATGRPVIATRVGGIPWMVEDGVTGYVVDPGDVEGMAERMLDLFQHADRRTRMGLAAREAAMHRFDGDLVADETVRVYQALASRAHEVGAFPPRI